MYLIFDMSWFTQLPSLGDAAKEMLNCSEMGHTGTTDDHFHIINHLLALEVHSWRNPDIWEHSLLLSLDTFHLISGKVWFPSRPVFTLLLPQHILLKRPLCLRSTCFVTRVFSCICNELVGSPLDTLSSCGAFESLCASTGSSTLWCFVSRRLPTWGDTNAIKKQANYVLWLN